MATPIDPEADFLRLVPSGEVYLKSRRTRDSFLRALVANLREGLNGRGLAARVKRSGHHEVRVDAEDLQTAADACAATFGVNRVDLVTPISFDSLEQLSKQVAEVSRGAVRGRTFAVRVKRRGAHDWRSKDAEVEIGNLLLADSAGVNLSQPEVTVRVHVRDDDALLVEDTWPGADGLPAGTQERVLVLLSGGIDSPVAAWMMMRRGCAVDYLHLKLDCSVSDHALVVGDSLVDRWGHGTESRFHVLDFQDVKDQLRRRLPPRIRQVVLKQLMLSAAAEVARRSGIGIIVTGDSLGQVSSQTAAHLAAIDRYVSFPTLRPLVGLSKEEIVARARDIGTFQLSVRAREVCDLSDGRPVETRASAERLRRGHDLLDDDLVAAAVATWESVSAREWLPGAPLAVARVDRASTADERR